MCSYPQNKINNREVENTLSVSGLLITVTRFEEHYTNK